MTPQDEIAARRRLARYALGLFVLVAWGWSFAFFDHGFGVARGLLLAAGLGGLLLLRLRVAPGAPPRRLPAPLRPVLLGFVLGAVAIDLGIGVAAVARTIESGEIRMDQGEAGYRAARLLLRGEDPYAQGMLLDPEAYLRRLDLRSAAGAPSALAPDTRDAALQLYWQTLDPALRLELLPPPAPDAGPRARRENAILGYKYGPVIPLVTAPLALAIGPGAVPLLNLAATASLWAVLAWLIADCVGGEMLLLALAALLLDVQVTRNFLAFTASDVWPLAFGAAAVLAWRRGAPVALGLALALALGSKLMPALLYLPLLAAARSWRAAAACAVAAALLFAPFLWWDATGIVGDLVLWPALMTPDDTSWLPAVPAHVALAIRVALVSFALVLAARWMVGRERRICWTLACLAVAAAGAGPVFHNNYAPWFTVWMVAALAEACFEPPAQPASASLARVRRLRTSGSRWRFLRRIDFGVTSTSSSSSI